MSDPTENQPVNVVVNVVGGLTTVDNTSTTKNLRVEGSLNVERLAVGKSPTISGFSNDDTLSRNGDGNLRRHR